MESTHLSLELRSYSREVQTHQHDYHQLVLPLTGRLTMNVGSREGIASSQHAAVIAAGQNHGFAAPDMNRFIVADIPTALAPELERLPAFIPIDPALAQYVLFLHQQMSQQTPPGQSSKRSPNQSPKESPANRRHSSERQMLLLLIQLLRERYGGATQLDRRVEAASAYLEQHFQQPVSLAQLAAVAHLSSRQLSELFRRQLGMTPQQYLTERRMQQAWQLLETGDLNVQQIAERVGYSSLSAFSDRFRKHFGHSPRYFR